MIKSSRRMARQPADAGEAAILSSEGAAPPSTDKTKPNSKIATVVALLQRAQGATLDEIAAATSWQKHTVRASLTGLKKKGHTIDRTKRDDLTCYRIAPEV